MERRAQAREHHEWQDEMPAEDGLYEYRGPLYAIDSDSAVDCSPFCRINVRKGDGLRVSFYGEDGQEYDITRTGAGMWRGPVGPVHIPIEDARRSSDPEPFDT